ncbi:DNA-binding protein [Streptomyces chitinivorans]|uniref:DNA-binding protein n=1 Tax=Streptomyces chitinivorans TaxID=1257027 RepID=A0ABW7HP92_9ACTN|nr:DNA-binding protein [Streptomyces chitinivorans]MDH2410301.1 DNA-binding protein [Streptomyces chitinivorans]
MARGRMTPSGAGTLILDSQGLSLYLEQDRRVLAIVRSALDRGVNRVVSGATLIEAMHSGVKSSRWNFVLSQLDVKPLSVEWSKEAANLLTHTGLHGHKYAIDAMVAVTAMHQSGPVVMLTSDVDDMGKLCGERVALVAV